MENPSKILVIEPDRELGEAAASILAAKGGSARWADGVDAGLGLLAQVDPDLILIALDLSDADKARALAEFRSRAPQARIAGLTASSDQAYLDAAREMGISSFVLKGPGIVAFLRTLDRCVDHGGHGQAPASGKLKIMVVDDEPNIREVLRRFLTGKGYEVVLAENGEKALALASAERPVLALLDIAMPGINGVETLARLRREHPQMGVIMITANTDEELARECMRLGAADYISKPFNFDYLETSVMAKIILLAK